MTLLIHALIATGPLHPLMANTYGFGLSKLSKKFLISFGLSSFVTPPFVPAPFVLLPPDVVEVRDGFDRGTSEVLRDEDDESSSGLRELPPWSVFCLRSNLLRNSASSWAVTPSPGAPTALFDCSGGAGITSLKGVSMESSAASLPR